MIRDPLLPGSAIGVIGGGQLGRMLALEARRMGYRCVVLDPDPGGPAGQVADEVVAAPLGDADAMLEFARRVDVVTLEWENADLDAVRAIERIVPVRPGSGVLRVAQHRLREKHAARDAGLRTAEFAPVGSRDELRSAVERIGAPAVLKTCSGGYDGRGQARIASADEAELNAAWASLGAGEVDLILEGWVSYEREVSVIIARGTDGAAVPFPVAENVHRDGILDLTLVPARVSDAVAARAREVATRLAEHLGVVGLLAVEMFATSRGDVLVNEIAPRPHNSGHYTWEACAVSQFEQQLRAVCGLPLDPARLLSPAAMANLLGQHAGTGAGRGGVAEALAAPDVALHLYGKAEARPGRKMGHITALAASADEAARVAVAARDALGAP
jgi:5-(carboxyamino)imidazole ribonucleotide synthase